MALEILKRYFGQKERDFGISRMALVIALYNLFIFEYGAIVFRLPLPATLLMVLFGVILVLCRPLYIDISPLKLFLLFIFTAHFFVLYNYFLVGEYDRLVGGLRRLDPFVARIDLFIFGKIGSQFIEDQIALIFGTGKKYFYDLLVLNYVVYFFSPILVGALYFRTLHKSYVARIGCCFTTYLSYYAFNLLFYLLMPVTGPQYYFKDQFTTELPFSSVGQVLFNLISSGQKTHIDCFPSGHFGILLLSTIWLHRLKSNARYPYYFFTFFMILSTIGLRYHYLFDLIASIPFVFLSFRFGHYLYKLRPA